MRFNRRIESLEHELAVEEIGVTREAIRSVMNEEMWGRPRKKGGNESTGERKDGKMLMKRERKLRAREFEEDEGYY